MPVHIAFLRAVNIGKRPYPMAELRAALTAAGFDDVGTHIQTGNVRVRSPLRSRAEVEAALERVFETDRGFAVPTIVFTPAELTAIADDADALSAEFEPGRGHYVSVLKDELTAAKARQVEAASTDVERLVVRGRAVHLLCEVPYHEARLSNAFIEAQVRGSAATDRKSLGVATNRNATVIRALREKWGA